MNFLIYGANGYTGALVARLALKQGLHPVVAARNPESLAALAQELNLEHRVFSLNDPAALEAGIRDMKAVLHCAGPFVHTSRAMVDACLHTKVDYLDVTGEIDVFESCAARDQEAKAAGIMLLPGVGFDVVPSDCLAAHLKRRLPSATRLALGFQPIGGLSRGTATTMAENIHRGGMVRRSGKLTKVPGAWKSRTIDFGRGPVKAITIPWGDVATAFYSTGIPDIEVYMAAPLGLRLASRASRYLGWLLASAPVQRRIKKRIQAGPPGPSEEQRARGQSRLWGEAADDAGRRVASRLEGPEGYTLTALTALAAIKEVLAGNAPSGFQTPSMAYGADFILKIEGVIRQDLEGP
jgi:short subunit dehydrogenase-like uncharacterized protein